MPLIVVLGHSRCGAVKAAIGDLGQQAAPPGAIGGLVELIRPAVERVKTMEGDMLENAIVGNVQLGVERLKTLEPILAPAFRENRLTIVGATYDLASGRVRLVG